MSTSNEEFDRLRKEIESNYGSPMQAFMSQLHEMYISLKRAGFTRREAMYMISKLFNEMILGQAEQDKHE